MSEALIIDDNRETADALKQMLEVLGVPSRAAYGSSPAISALSRMTPRLILLDINMPGIDGTEILAFLHREPRLTFVPVIVVTSDDQPETKHRVLQGGAVAVIIKPVDFTLLEAALKKAGIQK
jgi:CheY-like chemotaxis protein